MNTIRAYANATLYSDIKPFEVIEIKTAGKVMIRKMDAWLINSPTLLALGGFAATYDNHTQTYEYASNEKYPVFAIRWSKKRGNWFNKDGVKFTMSDEPIEYYDFNF